MPKPTARVAIITRTKDRPVLLPRAMESVLGQRYSEYLHVIVNDAGDKALTEASIAPYRERYGDKLLVIQKDHSTGMEGASNTGIAACDSEFILIHDDDDTLHPDFLMQMVEYLDRPQPIGNLGGAVCQSTAVYERITGTQVQETERRPFNHWMTEVTLWRMCAWNFFPPYFLSLQTVRARANWPVHGKPAGAGRLGF